MEMLISPEWLKKKIESEPEESIEAGSRSIMLESKEALDVAIYIAAKYHRGQEDKGGEPYILHPIRVMMGLGLQDYELMAIAVLHDVVEDTEYTLQMLKYRGFSNRVVAGVDALSIRDNEERDDYIKRVRSNPDAVRIKIQDLRDNTDIMRLLSIEDRDIRRLKLYHKTHMDLKELVCDKN